MKQVIGLITNAVSREEVEKALQDLKVSELNQVANHFQVYAKGNKQHIKNSIVEGTIGAKLRSKAIRGTRL